jgi:hypothetical protein
MSFVLMVRHWHPDAMTATATLLHDDTVVIRRAVGADADALARLAALDSQPTLRGTALIAESDGVIRAAYSPDEHRAVADPFRPTAALVALLRTRAQLLRDGWPARTPATRRRSAPREALATRL